MTATPEPDINAENTRTATAWLRANLHADRAAIQAIIDTEKPNDVADGLMSIIAACTAACLDGSAPSVIINRLTVIAYAAVNAGLPNEYATDPAAIAAWTDDTLSRLQAMFNRQEAGA